MNDWLIYFGFLWGLIGSLVALFVVVDARNAFDGDPPTATLTSFLRAFTRRSRGHTALMASLILSLFIIPTWLYFHLIVQRERR